MRTIAIIQEKLDYGKTITSMNVSAVFTEQGQTTLIVCEMA